MANYTVTPEDREQYSTVLSPAAAERVGTQGIYTLADREDDGTPTGALQFRIFRSRDTHQIEAAILYFYVDPDCRNYGIGSSLLGQMYAILHQNEIFTASILTAQEEESIVFFLEERGFDFPETADYLSLSAEFFRDQKAEITRRSKEADPLEQHPKTEVLEIVKSLIGDSPADTLMNFHPALSSMTVHEGKTVLFLVYPEETGIFCRLLCDKDHPTAVNQTLSGLYFLIRQLLESQNPCLEQILISEKDRTLFDLLKSTPAKFDARECFMASADLSNIEISEEEAE